MVNVTMTFNTGDDIPTNIQYILYTTRWTAYVITEVMHWVFYFQGSKQLKKFTLK